MSFWKARQLQSKIPTHMLELLLFYHYNKDRTSKLSLQFIFNTSTVTPLTLGWGINIAGTLSIYCCFGLLELKRDRCILLEELVKRLHRSIRVNGDLKKRNKEKKMWYGLCRTSECLIDSRIVEVDINKINNGYLHEWKANIMYYLQDQSFCSLLEKRGLLGNHQPETMKDENFILRVMWRSYNRELTSMMHTKDTVQNKLKQMTQNILENSTLRKECIRLSKMQLNFL